MTWISHVPNRVALVMTAGLVIVSVGGHLGLSATGGPTMQADTYVIAEPVTTVPQTATVVNAGDSQIQDIQPVQAVLKKAAMTQDRADVAISGHEKEQTIDALQTLPPTKEQTGILVRYKGSVYRVSLSEYL